MIPRPIKVEAIEDYKLIINFDNGEERVYDMKKNLNIPFYRDLKMLFCLKKLK